MERVGSVQDFLDFALKHDSEKRAVAYRGHESHKFLLQPKVFRKTHQSAKKYEERILSEVLLEAPDEFASDKTTFEHLVRAQHYGLPTRLLDVTMNPLVALYFACSNGGHNGDDGEVIQFSINPERVKFFDSDTVSCIANMAKLSYVEKNDLYQYYKSFEGKGGTTSIDRSELNERSEVARLIQFIRIEKPYFLSEIDPVDLWRLLFVFPKKSNRRIIAQSGAFIIAGLLKEINSSTSKAIAIRRLKIEARKKKNILGELDKLNINGRTLFPEIENITEYIERRYVNW